MYLRDLLLKRGVRVRYVIQVKGHAFDRKTRTWTREGGEWCVTLHKKRQVRGFIQSFSGVEFYVERYGKHLGEYKSWIWRT